MNFVEYLIVSQEFLQKAEENLQAAHLLLENGLYNAATNRAYYAAFQEAVFALESFGVQSGTLTHISVQALFNGELVNRRKIFPARVRSFLVELQYNRNKADYETTHISKTVAARQFAKAKEFVKMIQERKTQ